MFGKLFKKQQRVISVQELMLTTIGMRFTHVYKIIKTDSAFKLERYINKYSGGKSYLELEIRRNCDEAFLIELMNVCDVIGWDGFFGKHPKNVSDGIMFEFSATVNDGMKIQAQGSQNFPRGYLEFIRTLDHMIFDAIVAYEEENSKNLKSFHTDLTFGIDEKIYLDLKKKQLMFISGGEFYVIGSDEIIGFEGVITEVCENGNDDGYSFCLKLSLNTPLFEEICVDLAKGNRPKHPEDDWYLECHMQLLELKSRLREWTYKPKIEQTFLG